MARHKIGISPGLLRRLEKGSANSFPRLENALSKRNTATDLGINTTTLVSYVEEVQRTSAYGFWRLGESSGSTAVDSNILGGTYHPGTYIGSHTKGVTGPLVGDTDTAVSFTGGYVEVSAHTDFDFLRTNSFVFESWVKASGATNGALISTVDDGSSTKQGWEVSYDAGADLITFHLMSDEVTSNGLVVTATHDLHDGSFHHLWVQYAGTSTPSGVAIYVDSAVKTKTTVMNGLTGSTVSGENLQIAGRIGGPYTTVTLDEVAVYRAIPDPRSVLWHYQAGMGIEVQK